MLMLGLEIYMGMRSSLTITVREVSGTALSVVSCTTKMNSLEGADNVYYLVQKIYM